ncbi:MAG: hypothetical protein ACK4JF_07195 [Methylohalobius sp.]
MSDTQDTYWIFGHADGIGERPKLAAEEPHPAQKSDDETWKTILRLPESPLSLQELTEILNQLDRLRDPD